MLKYLCTNMYKYLANVMCKGCFPCRGVFPAVSGQFVSHGLRTFAFEGSLTGLKAISGGAAELQVGLLSSPLTASQSDMGPLQTLHQTLQLHTTT